MAEEAVLTQTEFTDRVGDTLTASLRTPWVAGEVDITIDESGQSGCVFLDFEQTENLANNLLTLIGKKTVSASSIPLASNVTFNEAVLRVAAAHKRTVQFRYAKQNGGYIESRRVNPEEVVGEGASLAVRGNDPDRGATRRYRLDRIQGEVSFA